MWAFGRNGGKVEDQDSPELQKRNHHSSSSINSSQRQYYERPMSPQQQQQQQQKSLGRGRHNFQKNGIKKIVSPRNQPAGSPRQQPQSPRAFQRNNNGRNFRAKRFGGGGFLGKKKAHPDLDLKGMNVNDTTDGIEVSFEPNTPSKSSRSIVSPRGNVNKNSATKSPRGKFNFNAGKNNKARNQNRTEEARDPSVAEEDVAAASITIRYEPVISLQDHLRQRQRFYKSQFSISGIAAPSTTTIVQAAGPAERSLSPGLEPVTTSWRPNGHRIPLCGVQSDSHVSFTDTVHLLQSMKVTSEMAAVQQELSHLKDEIAALEQDRNFLEKQMNAVSVTLSSVSPAVISSSSSGVSGTSMEWNLNVVLQEDALKKQSLDSARRMALQRQRGNCLTIHVHDTRTQEMLVHKCGGKLHHIQRTRLFKKDDTIVTLSPSNCRPHGAATCVQDIVFLSSDKTNGFFLSKDSGQSQSHGRIPNKLFRRMKLAENHEIGDIKYLSTGPHGSYYAEFQSGECWWGFAVEDMELHRALQSWDVHRIAFGSMEFLDEESPDNRDNSKTVATCSWIVVARDGCVAWKNLPSSLSQALESRIANKCAPIEVSLGPGGSYFVRFLDGSVDYSLPAKVARVCDRIEKRGGLITNVCLHPDVSHDFIIRHTEIGV
jgi:hypothetical protein